MTFTDTYILYIFMGFPAGAGGPEPPCQCRGHVPLQYSCLEHPMVRGAWRATVRGVAELDMTDFHFHSSLSKESKALPRWR